MARGRKSGPTRMDMRRQSEAAEAREKEVVVPADDEVEADDDEEADAEVEVDPDAEIEAELEVDPDAEVADDEEVVPKKKKAAVKKKKAAVAKVKKPAVKRVRTVKEVRQKAVWVVFDNSSKVVDRFDYNKKDEAEALLARKIQEKEGKATFYMNLVKEPLE